MFGKPAREPGARHAFTYYHPKPIPRDLPRSARVVAALSEADATLGQLQGLSTLIVDPSMLIGPYLQREALASSRIEGTQASLSEVFQSKIDVYSQTEDTLEAMRYLEATPDTAAFVPPLPQYLGELLADWEQFANIDGNAL